MTSDRIKEQTRREWRELGFYYECDEATRTWRIVGSRSGLLAFARLLAEYSGNPRNASLSEHDHYGPCLYLKIATSTEREIYTHCIAGTLEDIAALSSMVKSAVASSAPNQVVDIGHQYLPCAEARLLLEVAPDEFDPAKADTECW